MCSVVVVKIQLKDIRLNSLNHFIFIMCKLNTAAAIWIKSLPSRLFEVTLNTYNLHGLVMRWSSIVSGNLERNIW